MFKFSCVVFHATLIIMLRVSVLLSLGALLGASAVLHLA